MFAGTLNLGAPITVRATATGGATLLAECVRLIEAAEARARPLRRARRPGGARATRRRCTCCALATFLFWWLSAAARRLEQALLTAGAVLIITCPCALALAVPAVQVIATSRLFRAGMLLKSPTALERLAEVGHRGVRQDRHADRADAGAGRCGGADPAALRVAASLAACSRHPLARALAAAAGAGAGRGAA